MRSKKQPLSKADASPKQTPPRKVAAEPASLPSRAAGRRHFWLGVQREFENVRVFTARRWPRVVRPEYADLYCPHCGSLDGWQALSRGVSDNVLIRNEVDWATSSDGATIVSDRTRQVLEQAASGELRFFPLQDGKHFVLWVTNVIEIPPGEKYLGRNARVAVIYSTKGRCSECGRLLDSYVRPAEYDYAGVANLVGLKIPNVESPARFALIVHDHLGDEMTAHGIKGWRKHPIDQILPKR